MKLDEAKLKLTLKSVNLLGKKAREAAMSELGATAIQMLGDATKKLRENGSVSTSFLVNSGKVKNTKHIIRLDIRLHTLILLSLGAK